MNRAACVQALMLLCACLLPTTLLEAAEPAAALLPVTAMQLDSPATTRDSARLDVGLVVFDAGLPADEATYAARGIFPQIRRAEAKFLPVVLRHVLMRSDAWGVVRVLPRALPSAELLLSASIVHSDGQRLILRVEVHDATGRQWLAREYLDQALAADYPVEPDGDPFINLYYQLANDLLAVRQTLSEADLREIRQVGLLRYANTLAPDAFGGYLGQTGEGQFRVRHLPAEGDPMMARVQRILQQEYRFIDTVDEQYAALYDGMAPTYNQWRQFDREQALYRRDYQRRAQARDAAGPRGTYAAMEQAYNIYKLSKIHEQDLEELAQGFNNEVQPTVMEANGRVFRLNGSLDGQYADWRRILQRIFALETGVAPDVRAALH